MSFENPNPTRQASPAGGDEGGFFADFRSAREEKGWTLEEVSEKLRLPQHLIEAMEAGRLDALGASVFSRSYLRSYGRLLGLPVDLVVATVDGAEPEEPVPLRTRQYVPKGRFLLERYGRRAVYLALTAGIVLPMLLFSTRYQLSDPTSLLTPAEPELETSATAELAALHPDGLPSHEFVGPPALAARASAETQTVSASLTPFYKTLEPALPPPPPAAPEPAETGLVLEISAESWIEITDVDEGRLVHDLLAAGSRRSFASAAGKQLVLGNARGVKVLLNGEPVDTSAHTHANVARFAISSEGLIDPPAE